MRIYLATAMLCSFAALAAGKRGGRGKKDKDTECSYETADAAKEDGEWIRGALRACCWSEEEASWCTDALAWTGDCAAEVLDENEKSDPA